MQPPKLLHPPLRSLSEADGAEIDVVTEARLILALLPQGTLHLIHYDHGGGRLYRQEDLIADFYDAASREFYANAPELITRLCNEVQKLREELSAIKGAGMP